MQDGGRRTNSTTARLLSNPAIASTVLRAAISPALKAEIEGDAAFLTDSWALAKKAYDRLLSEFPQYQEDAKIYNHMGICCLNMHEYEEAVILFQKAAEKNYKGIVDLNCNLGTAYLMLEKFEEALGCYREVARLKPDHSDLDILYYNMASAYLAQKKWKEAIKYCDKALATPLKNTNAGDLHFNKGLALTKLSCFNDALASYQNAIILNPVSCAKAFENMAEIYYMQGKFEEAKKHYLAAIGANHQEPVPILCGLAEIYARKGDYKSLLECYDQIQNLKFKDCKFLAAHMTKTYKILLLNIKLSTEGAKEPPSLDDNASDVSETPTIDLNHDVDFLGDTAE